MSDAFPPPPPIPTQVNSTPIPPPPPLPATVAATVPIPPIIPFTGFKIRDIASDDMFCSIPGLSIASKYGFFPQSVVFTNSILWYYFIDSWHNRPKTTGPLTGLGLSFILIQAWLITKYCDVSIFKIAGGAILGIASALSMYGAINGFTNLFNVTVGGKESFTVREGYSTNDKVFPFDKQGASKKLSDDPNVGTCAPPNDEDQFVCEMYKDGQLVTSTIAS